MVKCLSNIRILKSRNLKYYKMYTNMSSELIVYSEGANTQFFDVFNSCSNKYQIDRQILKYTNFHVLNYRWRCNIMFARKQFGD